MVMGELEVADLALELDDVGEWKGREAAKKRVPALQCLAT
jgi:hypothetical protein